MPFTKLAYSLAFSEQKTYIIIHEIKCYITDKQLHDVLASVIFRLHNFAQDYVLELQSMLLDKAQNFNTHSEALR